MNNRIIYSLIICVCSIQLVWGQQELGLYLLKNSWQANQLNPAFFPDNGQVVIGLPGIYNNSFIGNFNTNDVISNDQLDANLLIGQLDNENDLRQQLDIETISVGVATGPFKIFLSHGLNLNGIIRYPKTLPQLIWQGNQQFIGETVSFAPDIQVVAYQELALGLAYAVSSNFSVGGRIKYLNGIASATSSGNQLDLFTDPDAYQLTLNSNYTVNSSGFVVKNGLLDFGIETDVFNNRSLFTPNSGFAVDLGVNFSYKQLQVAASVLDIGSISWSDNPTNYTLSGVQEFQGLDALEDLLEDDSDVGSIIDTLEMIYDPTETFNTYDTPLPTRAYLGLSYEVHPKVLVGGTFYLESFEAETYTAASIGVQVKPVSFLNVGTSLAYRNESISNVGLNAHATFGPVQILAATDNIVSLVGSSSEFNTNFRFGLNLIFGQNKPKDYNEVEHTDDFFRK